MSGLLLDTNVPLELTRTVSDAHVERWLDSADDKQLFFSAISLGEVRKGTAMLPWELGGENWSNGSNKLCTRGSPGAILPVNDIIAERWGVLSAEQRLKGRPIGMADGLIAATALEHELIVVTRNVKDIASLGVVIFNPWERR